MYCQIKSVEINTLYTNIINEARVKIVIKNVDVFVFVTVLSRL
jgi:hypothetical protein